MEADSFFQKSLQKEEKTCPLADGTSISFDQLDLNELEGHPSFWGDGRVLRKEEGGGISNDSLRLFLTEKDPGSVLEQLDYNIVESKTALISGGEISFENAVEIGGWLFQWNGESLPAKNVPAGGEEDICPSCRLGLIYICGAIIILILLISFFLWWKKKD